MAFQLGVSLAVLLAASAAHAADLATNKPEEAPGQPNCFSSLWAYLNSTPEEGRLSAYDFTVFGVIDMGYGYESSGVPFNRSLLTGVEEHLQKNGNRSLWLLTPNALSQSSLGIEMAQPIAPGWSVIAKWDFGFDPYTLGLANGPGPIAENNLVPLADQKASGDSARAGQWYNGQLFAGIQNDTYGSLVGGRVNSLLLDAVSAYDPFGGSYAFSIIGFSGLTAGGGYTENTRYNTAIKYTGKFPGPFGNFHVAGLVQVAGYGAGNGSTNGAQAGAGIDWGGFSGDVIYSWVEDGVIASTIPSAAYPLNSLRATLSNNSAVMLAAEYNFDRLTVYGGYEHINFLPPNRASTAPLHGVGGYYFSDVVVNAYTADAGSFIGGPKPFNVFWTVKGCDIGSMRPRSTWERMSFFGMVQASRRAEVSLRHGRSKQRPRPADFEVTDNKDRPQSHENRDGFTAIGRGGFPSAPARTRFD